jgi:hypothetical protein
MCFNGANTYQLGWYSAYYVNLPVVQNFDWTGDLVGFAEKSAALVSDKMIIRIIGGTTDVYVHFNRQVGINAETQEGGNQVLVTTHSMGTGYAPSVLPVKLSAGAIVMMPNFTSAGGDSLHIIVNSINNGAVPARANVSIQLVLLNAATKPAPFLSTSEQIISPPVAVIRTLAQTTKPTTSLPTTAPTRLPTKAINNQITTYAATTLDTTDQPSCSADQQQTTHP